MNAWTHILTAKEITVYHALTASIDPAFAAQDQAFYESRNAAQLSGLAHGAWLCNEPGSYQIARSYAALLSS